MRKLTALVLTLCMALTLCSFAGAEEAAGLPEMNTTDPITLRFLTWDDFEMADALAARFMEKYPNITVVVERTTTADVTSTLTNMAADNDLPDVYFFLDLPPLLVNKTMYDITEFVENDPETPTLYRTLQRKGYVDGKRCFYMCGEFLPATYYLDMNVFELMNEPMPSQDWTWEEYEDLVDRMTDPSQNVWGYFSSMFAIVTAGPIALAPNSMGEFGWDGERYHFEGWVEALEFQQRSNRMKTSLIWNGADPSLTDPAYLALHPDNEWPGQTGHVAIVADASWTLNDIYTRNLALDRGIKMVPYMPPVGGNVENGGQYGFLDNVTMSANCEHPREAYELMKYMCWGKEGWMERLELFTTLTTETGEPRYRVPNCVPMITDEEVVNGYIAIMPDLGYWNDWASYMAAIKAPVGIGGQNIAGFGEFLSNYYFAADFGGVIGIEAAMEQGVVDGDAYVDQLNEQGVYWHNQVLETFYSIYGRPEE